MYFKILVTFAVLTVSFADSEEEKEHHEAQPYRYGYETKSNHGSQFRKEESDGKGTVKGSYGYTDHDGIYREVHYVADHDGFRAEIKTNEPGTIDQEHPHVLIHSSAHHEPEEYSHQQVQQRSSHGDFSRLKPIRYQQKNKEKKISTLGQGSFLYRRTGEHGGHE